MNSATEILTQLDLNNTRPLEGVPIESLLDIYIDLSHRLAEAVARGARSVDEDHLRLQRIAVRTEIQRRTHDRAFPGRESCTCQTTTN